MSTTTAQAYFQVPAEPAQSQPIQADSATTLILAIAFLIKTTSLSIALLIKVSKR
ncbi:MAG: hypothetical protein J0L70_11220 [Leptolyngbya sp. UWPOB_LEPTO1]|uniref:hypothetical protein n=1 Tax=Leptolyngbya sp. UWPOB_LEPTO1 TaxID=2815653 RepID=UPI001AC98406|nr:hypothetical protein [Leptolyngbya sp. UWPOB_LEPTO1]MBN8561087.1 hypothetical protein [Leptolyngbya sp. UWPOB_LEPTO1]